MLSSGDNLIVLKLVCLAGGGRRGFKTKAIERDHIHEGNKVRRYKFESAGQLLEDSWNDVKRIVGDA
jgi:hypothetical protein